MLPLYINADNAVIVDEVEDSSNPGEYLDDATLSFTVYRHMANDGAMTIGFATITASEAAFVAGDAGRSVVVRGAGVNGADLRTTIATYVSATEVTLSTAASTTVSNAFVRMSLPSNVSISMPYVDDSDGKYRGVVNDTTAIKRNTKYWIEIMIDAGSGKKDFRVLEIVSAYREET